MAKWKQVLPWKCRLLVHHVKPGMVDLFLYVLCLVRASLPVKAEPCATSLHCQQRCLGGETHLVRVTLSSTSPYKCIQHPGHVTVTPPKSVLKGKIDYKPLRKNKKIKMPWAVVENNLAYICFQIVFCSVYFSWILKLYSPLIFRGNYCDQSDSYSSIIASPCLLYRFKFYRQNTSLVKYDALFLIKLHKSHEKLKLSLLTSCNNNIMIIIIISIIIIIIHSFNIIGNFTFKVYNLLFLYFYLGYIQVLDYWSMDLNTSSTTVRSCHSGGVSVQNKG